MQVGTVGSICWITQHHDNSRIGNRLCNTLCSTWIAEIENRTLANRFFFCYPCKESGVLILIPDHFPVYSIVSQSGSGKVISSKKIHFFSRCHVDLWMLA